MTACPIPKSEYERIVLGHGSGGRLTASLIARVFAPAFQGEVVEDQATVELAGAKVAFTTDAYVVRPLFFPGGDIGRLAVCGTVNDLAVGGAVPRFISAAFILEEGLPLEHLQRIVQSMRAACEEAGVKLVTGDTKVVDRGKGDGVFITTTGIGVAPSRSLSVTHARPGDAIIVSGTIGDHGIAIMSAREGLEFETVLESDVAPLHHVARAVTSASDAVRCMRDATRGGLAGVLNDIATASNVGVKIDESMIPLRREVRAACEMLGLDPLHVACEGRLVAVVPREDAERAVDRIRSEKYGENARVIGAITSDHPGIVALTTSLGTERIVQTLSGEQLPRIC